MPAFGVIAGFVDLAPYATASLVIALSVEIRIAVPVVARPGIDQIVLSAARLPALGANEPAMAAAPVRAYLILKFGILLLMVIPKEPGRRDRLPDN
jgi:hypothetical protein